MCCMELGTRVASGYASQCQVHLILMSEHRTYKIFVGVTYLEAVAQHNSDMSCSGHVLDTPTCVRFSSRFFFPFSGGHAGTC